MRVEVSEGTHNENLPPAIFELIPLPVYQENLRVELVRLINHRPH